MGLWEFVYTTNMLEPQGPEVSSDLLELELSVVGGSLMWELEMNLDPLLEQCSLLAADHPTNPLSTDSSKLHYFLRF